MTKLKIFSNASILGAYGWDESLNLKVRVLLKLNHCDETGHDIDINHHQGTQNKLQDRLYHQECEAYKARFKLGEKSI